jgi:hypothetical protein
MTQALKYQDLCVQYPGAILICENQGKTEALLKLSMKKVAKKYATSESPSVDAQRSVHYLTGYAACNDFWLRVILVFQGCIA